MVAKSTSPQLAGLSLGRSGAAFELTRPAKEDTRVQVGSWRVTTAKGIAVIVASGRVRGYETAVRAAIPRAEEALDKLSIRGIDDAQLASADHEHLAWWTTTAGTTLRVVSTTFQPLPTLNVRVEVRDPKGRLVRPPRPAPMPWHPSFRFFRLSQTTTDLFDAYRNAFLALESLLAARTPQLRKSPGEKGEQEGTWFRRALRATGVDLSKFVRTSRGLEADEIYRQLYVDTRVRLFHSKPERDPLLPRDRRTAQAVSRALDLTTRLYLAVVEARLGVVRLQGGFTAYAASAMARAVLEPLTFVATSDETSFDALARVVAPAGASMSPFPHALPATYEGFSAMRIAWATAADLASLPYVRRIVGVAAHGQPYIQCRLEGRLAHAGIDRLEVEFRIVMRNGRDLSSGLV